jgi:hypothetical protein
MNDNRDTLKFNIWCSSYVSIFFSPFSTSGEVFIVS